MTNSIQNRHDGEANDLYPKQVEKRLRLAEISIRTKIKNFVYSLSQINQQHLFQQQVLQIRHLSLHQSVPKLNKSGFTEAKTKTYLDHAGY